MSNEEPPKGAATPAGVEKKLTPQELIKHSHGEATSRLARGDTSLPFDLVWNSLGAIGKPSLLSNLLCGNIRCEGIFSQHIDDHGYFSDIDRIHWVAVTPEYVGQAIDRFGSFSLNSSHDEGTGFWHILLKRGNALMELLDYSDLPGKIDVEAADSAWYNANQSQFGHKVNALTQAALALGLVTASPTALKKYLLSQEHLWKQDKRPTDETMKNYCQIAVKAHRDSKRLLENG